MRVYAEGANQITFQSIKVIGKRNGAEQRVLNSGAPRRWKSRGGGHSQVALWARNNTLLDTSLGRTIPIISLVEPWERIATASVRLVVFLWLALCFVRRAAAATARWPGWRRRWRNRHHSPPPAPITPASRYKFRALPIYIYVVVFVCAYFNNSDLIGRTHLRWVIYLPLRSQLSAAGRTRKMPGSCESQFWSTHTHTVSVEDSRLTLCKCFSQIAYMVLVFNLNAGCTQSRGRRDLIFDVEFLDRWGRIFFSRCHPQILLW